MALESDEEILRRAVLRMNVRGWGVTVGLLLGASLFVATNVLVLRGGDLVGPHLSLLGAYFPGYAVTFVGSLVGFVYAALLGYLVGWTVGAVYNKLVDVPR
ncbi:MAG: hypothetical protein V3T48_11625 [Vicinamibacterales bacterium]